jgi:transcription initiation factor TFIIE subunit alpha
MPTAEYYILSPVNGVPKAFSEVTEDDHGLMTPEEYTAYFEVFEARASY